MKYYILFAVLATCMFTACEIDDSNLPDDIVSNFQKDRDESAVNNDGKFDGSLSVNVVNTCFFDGRVSAELNFKGEVKRYKYFYTDTDADLSSELVWKKMSQTSSVDVSEANFATSSKVNVSTYQYLYVAPYGLMGHGDYSKVQVSCSDSNKTSDIPDIMDFKRSGDNLTWTFGSGLYTVNYAILYDDDVVVASRLNDTELYMFAYFDHTCNPRQKPLEMSVTLPDNTERVMLIAMYSNGNRLTKRSL